MKSEPLCIAVLKMLVCLLLCGLATPLHAVSVLPGSSEYVVTAGETLLVPLYTTGEGATDIGGVDILVEAVPLSLTAGTLPLGTPLPPGSMVSVGPSGVGVVVGAPFTFDIPASGSNSVPFVDLAFATTGVGPGVYEVALTTILNEEEPGFGTAFRVEIAAIPEPSSMLLVLMGSLIACIGSIVRRRAIHPTA